MCLPRDPDQTYRQIPDAIHADDDGERLSTLFQSGADPAVATAGGFTPLHAVAMLSGSDGGQAGKIDVLMAAGARIEARAKTMYGDGWTPLHVAADEGQPAALRALLVAGADPDTRTADGATPLMLAVVSPRHGVAKVEMLFQAGADREQCDPNGETALDHAIRFLDRHRDDGWLGVAGVKAMEDVIHLLSEPR